MPPPGGFEPVKYKRNLPLHGPSGLVILGGVTAVCAYGFYRLGKGNLEKRYVESLRTFGRAGEVRRTANVGIRGPAQRETCLPLDPTARVASYQ